MPHLSKVEGSSYWMVLHSNAVMKEDKMSNTQALYLPVLFLSFVL